MKKLSLLAVLLTLGLVSGAAFAQRDIPLGDASVYFVSYFSNNVAAAPDATVRVINDGSNGNLWAAYYVFDDSQELTECCACYVSPDGINSESVQKNLTATPLTGKVPSRGVIKIVSSGSPNPYFLQPIAGLHGFATHIQQSSPSAILQVGPDPDWAITEAPLLDANLKTGEQALLQNLCLYSQLLSGTLCTCTPEDHDF
jgi:hypothetical protein